MDDHKSQRALSISVITLLLTSLHSCTTTTNALSYTPPLIPTTTAILSNINHQQRWRTKTITFAARGSGMGMGNPSKKKKGKNQKKKGGGGGFSGIGDEMSPLVSLTPEAKQLIKKFGGDVNRASEEYFRTRMERAASSSYGEVPQLNSDDEKNDDNNGIFPIATTAQTKAASRQRELKHEARVSACWDAVAMFLPNDYQNTRGKVAPDVDRRLKIISEVCCCCCGGGDIGKKNISVLDVGCGDGALVPYLASKLHQLSSMEEDGVDTSKKKNTKRSKTNLSEHYVGLDLSNEMIDLASRRFGTYFSNNPTSNFIVGSFPNDVPSSKNDETHHYYSTIVFNGSLQFFQDHTRTLRLASDFLLGGGGSKIILTHVNGAKFVKDECRRNPTVAVRPMPEGVSLDRIAEELGLIVRDKEQLFGGGGGGGEYDEELDGNDDSFYLVALEKP